MNLKAGRLLAKYYLRSFWRRTFIVLPMILFGISLFLFSLVLFPSLRARLRGSAFLATAEPPSLTISGIVYQAVIRGDGKSDHTPVEGAQVESGGFRTTTSPSGTFSLTILSPVDAEIPMIFSHSGVERVIRVSFRPGRKSLEHNFVFPASPGTP